MIKRRQILKRPQFMRGLSFDGVDDYVSIPALLNDGDDLSIILVFTPLSKRSGWAPTLTTYYGGWGFQLWDSQIDAKMMVNGTEYSVKVYSGSDYWGKTLFLAETVHYDAGTGETVLRGYKDGQFVGEKRVVGTTGMLSGRSWYLMKYSTVVAGGKVYVVFIYNRALSESEIKHVYQNPHNPLDKEHLVLWLHPGSVNISNSKWWDLSKYGNNGTIYGATLVEGESEVVV